MENIVFNKKLIIKFDRIVQGAYLTRSQADKKRYFHWKKNLDNSKKLCLQFMCLRFADTLRKEDIL